VRQELAAASQRDPSPHAGMGMGTTELSPELTEKLARLKRDNAALTACVNKAGLESVLAMENALDDATRLAATFEVHKYTKLNSRILPYLKLLVRGAKLCCAHV
jgi:hypothetical protein